MALRVLALVVAGQPERAWEALGPWQDLTPELTLEELGADGDDDPPRALLEARRDVVPVFDDARALAVAAGGAHGPASTDLALTA